MKTVDRLRNIFRDNNEEYDKVIHYLEMAVEDGKIGIIIPKSELSRKVYEFINFNDGFIILSCIIIEGKVEYRDMDKIKTFDSYLISISTASDKVEDYICVYKL